MALDVTDDDESILSVTPDADTVETAAASTAVLNGPLHVGLADRILHGSLTHQINCVMVTFFEGHRPLFFLLKN